MKLTQGYITMLEDLKPVSRQYSCKVRSILESLSEADRKILSNALESLEWSSSALTKALNEREISISRYSVISHRERQCSCWRI